MIPAKVALANNATCNGPSAAAVPNSTIVRASRPISTTTGASASASEGSRGAAGDPGPGREIDTDITTPRQPWSRLKPGCLRDRGSGPSSAHIPADRWASAIADCRCPAARPGDRFQILFHRAYPRLHPSEGDLGHSSAKDTKGEP